MMCYFTLLTCDCIIYPPIFYYLLPGLLGERALPGRTSHQLNDRLLLLLLLLTRFTVLQYVLIPKQMPLGCGRKPQFLKRKHANLRDSNTQSHCCDATVLHCFILVTFDTRRKFPQVVSRLSFVITKCSDGKILLNLYSNYTFPDCDDDKKKATCSRARI